MIKKIKIVSFLVLLSLVIAMIFGCNAEEQVIKEHLHSQQTKLTKVPLSELLLQEKFSTAYKKIPKKKVVKYDIAGRSALEDQYGFTILDAPVNVIEKDGQTYYNILIVSDNNTDNKIENLIITTLSNQENEFYQVKYKAPITTINALDVINQGVKDIINLENQHSTDTYRCEFLEVTSYFCWAAGGSRDCQGADTDLGCHGTTTMTMNCSGGGGFNYSGGSGGATGGSGGGGSGGSNGTIIGSPVIPTYTSINLTTTLSLNPAQDTWINNINNRNIKKVLQQFLFNNGNLFNNDNHVLAINLLNLAMSNNSTFTFDTALNNTNAISFNNVADLQSYLNNFSNNTTDTFSLTQQGDTKNARFRKTVNGFTHINVEVNQTLSPYTVNSVSSSISGNTFGLDLVQTTPNDAAQITTNANVVTINFLADIKVSLFMQGIGTLHTFHCTIIVKLNKLTGNPISIQVTGI